MSKTCHSNHSAVISTGGKDDRRQRSGRNDTLAIERKTCTKNKKSTNSSVEGFHCANSGEAFAVPAVSSPSHFISRMDNIHVAHRLTTLGDLLPTSPHGSSNRSNLPTNSFEDPCSSAGFSMGWMPMSCAELPYQWSA